ncbi:ectonucleotide pyrophosphatase/phosphodiesterase [Phenylobacterium sp.]|jgi:predicted AlkP superfamily pyrophosphatase or phosphodiesterase|uniref:alkaline phosphatase family protein n=1 Tax=Phenylobacterium sp. TaxID=1871053 RepID=UPI002F3EFB47
MTSPLRAFAALLALWLALVAAPALAADAPLTVLISIDGFRADYLDRGVTPTLSALAAGGVRGDMRPSFPSKTFPNHYTLVTGLRPDKNGIVDNNMYDPAITDKEFTMSRREVNQDPRWWEEAEPIWVTAEEAGVRTATMFWPGSDIPIHGVLPSHWQLFDQKVSAQTRVDTALSWLDGPVAERPRFLTLYFDDVDTAGHHEGPDSPELNAAAAKVDAAIGRFLDGLKARGITANIIVVADHGMAPVSQDRRIFVDDLLDMKAFRYTTAGAFLALNPAPGHEAEVDKALLKPHEHMQCWKKADIPARYHYGKNPRVPAIFCLPQTGWEITSHDYHPRTVDVGDHGFDNFAPEMRAIFVANGPAFRKGVRLPTFDNVDVYPLVAKLLGVMPKPNDGNLADTRPALTHGGRSD